MTNQIEVKEQVRWEDLEVEEEPRYFEGLGDAAAEMHKVICEEISRRKSEGSWDIPEVAEEQNECEGCFDPHCGVDPAKPGSDFTAGVLLAFGISASEWATALEEQSRVAMRIANGVSEFGRVAMLFSDVIALCTPSRVNLTGEWGVPRNG